MPGAYAIFFFYSQKFDAPYCTGEYVRHYSRGKHVLEQLGGKTLVMTLLSHEDPNVRLVHPAQLRIDFFYFL